jgi:hexosaminidase
VNQPYSINANNKLILGVQGDLWTETVQSEKRLEYLIFPRIAALSETAWTFPAEKNYDQFLSRLQKHLLWYQSAGISYYNPFAPGTTPEVVDK